MDSADFVEVWFEEWFIRYVLRAGTGGWLWFVGIYGSSSWM